MSGPRLYPPRSPLAGHIEYFGYWERGSTIDLRAQPFVGCPLGELENTCVSLTDLWGPSAESLLDELTETCQARQRVALLESFLADRMQLRQGSADSDVSSVIVAAEQNPSMRVSEAHDLTGLSAKRFTALFRSRVGLSPKAYIRARRLQAALRALDTAVPGATIAADLGYFDQAHFVREFQAFAAITPTQYAQRRSSIPGHVEISRAPRPKYTSQAT
jgi:AraC-like DNA-binding protein